MALNIVTSVVYGNFVFKNRTNKQIVILFYIGLSASRNQGYNSMMSII